MIYSHPKRIFRVAFLQEIEVYMRFFHLSDLHIGKQLHAYDLTETQVDVMTQVIEAAKTYRPDAILIAGDIYDKAAPSGEAFRLFDSFLRQLSDLEPKIPVMIISGNHDNNLRLSYAGAFLEKEQIYVSANLPQREEEHLSKIVLSDPWGNVNFYLLPFTKPADARNFLRESEGEYPSEEAEDKNIAQKDEMTEQTESEGTEKENPVRTYEEAVKFFLDREHINTEERNVLLAHQFFVAGAEEPERRDSEIRYLSIGGLDSVSTEVVEDFDYVALGHIHKAQKVGSEKIRYSGTPMKYSVSEASDEKCITMVTLEEKGKLQVEKIPLVLHPDVLCLKGTLEELIARGKDHPCDDYVSIILTNEESLVRPKDRLAEFYSRILEVQIENSRTLHFLQRDSEEQEDENMLTLFQEFFREMNQRPLNEEETEIVEQVIAKLSGSQSYTV